MKPPLLVRVFAPARLHFGLLSFGHPRGRSFGGAGVMVDAPYTCVELRAQDAWHVTGNSAHRASLAADNYFQATGQPPPSVVLNVVCSAPAHAGLGSGTQLTYAVVAALQTYFGKGQPSPRQLVAWSGRGRRSAIGTHGFGMGGLLVDGGKLPDEDFSPLVAHVALPPAWRWVLFFATEGTGLHGAGEEQAFATLPPVPRQHTALLTELLIRKLLPAARLGDCRNFGEALGEFGLMAGSCFEAIQGGPFARPEQAELAREIRQRGFSGVGQSSWGPTLFTLVPDQATGEKLVSSLVSAGKIQSHQAQIVSTSARGARYEVSF